MQTLVILVCCILSTSAVIQLQKLSGIKIPANANGDFSMFAGAAHKAAYDKTNRLLYVVSEQHNSNKSLNFLHILDLTNPSSPTIVLTHPFTQHNYAGPAGIAVCNNPADISKDIVAVSIPSTYGAYNGKVELFEPYTKIQSDITRLGVVDVGASPKNMAFTSDCSQLLVANEGVPGFDGPEYDSNSVFFDPEGRITIIISSKTSSPATLKIDFTSFNNRAQEFVNRGVRWVFRGDRDENLLNTFSQDLEPEDITISPDDRFAFISFKENNAIAKLDISRRQIIDIYPMGVKDFSTFDIDPSDRDGGAQMNRYKVYGMYQPSSIRYGIINGKGYLITADQGGYKTINYRTSMGGMQTFTDAVRIKTANTDMMLDRPSFDSQTLLDIDDDTRLGRLHMSKSDGLNYLFGKIDAIHIYGGRSVSMIDASTMSRAYETGSDLESNQIAKYSNTFNGDCSALNNSPTGERDTRSDDMGPEPTGLAIGTVDGVAVLVTGGRNGVLNVFSMRGVAALFESNFRDGATNEFWSGLFDKNTMGDAVITDIGYVEAADSTTGKPYVYVVGSASGTVSFYE